MTVTTSTEDRIEIKEKIPAGLRVFIFLLGLLPWLAPYELLIKPGWTGFDLYFLFLLIISLGAVALGLFFFVAALLGLNQTLTFDRKNRSITHAYEATLLRLKVKKYSFNQLTGIERVKHNWSDSPTTYGLKFTFTDGHSTEPVSFKTKQEANDLQEKIENFSQ